MKRYIDIVAIEKEMNRYIEHFASLGMVVDGNECFYKINELIADAPDVDVVEVVRCRECEYWKCNPNTTEYGVCKKVSYDDFEVVMDSDDFCSYGERSE